MIYKLYIDKNVIKLDSLGNYDNNIPMLGNKNLIGYNKTLHNYNDKNLINTIFNNNNFVKISDSISIFDNLSLY